MQYFFQQGGEDPNTSTDFFSSLVDMGMAQQDQGDTETPQEEQAPTEEYDNEFLQGLSEYAKESESTDLQSQIDELKQQLELSRVEAGANDQLSNLQEQLAIAQFYQSADGEDYLMSKYDNTAAPVETTPDAGTKYAPTTISQQLSQRESGGNYKAYTSAGGGEGAVGKYQFRWKTHKDWIKQVTGVANMEEFKNNPKAQEQAFAYWDKNTLTPNATALHNKLIALKKAAPSIDEIKKKIHFAGVKGASDYYLYGKETTDAFGTKTSTYAMGGYVNTFQGGRMGMSTAKKTNKYTC